MWMLLAAFAFFNKAAGQADTRAVAEAEAKQKHQQLHFQASGAGNNINVVHYRCQWQIDPRVRYLRGRVTTTFRFLADTSSQLVFDFYNGLTVDSVVFRNQKKQFYFLGSNLFKIQLGEIVNAGVLDSITIVYKGIPANSGFGAFNKQTHAGVPVIWTMSCPYAARDWWPCKQDLVDKPDSVDLIITTPQQYRAAGNGLLVSEMQEDTLKTYHWKHKYPIATYLVATAVTNYNAFTHKVQLPSMAPGDSMPVVNFVYPESQASAMVNTRNVLKIIQYYDSLVAPYPFRKEKYGHAQFGWGGGMEHQTMSFMTDFSFDLQAHELAHQWFGDHITCASWRDTWLNEGWATYMAALAGKRFATSNFLNWLNTSQNQVKAQAGGSVWVSDTTNINRVFDSRLTYTKGAMVLHMLRWTVGDSAFWAGVRNYQADPLLAYSFANTNQFVHHLEQASGKNLAGFMADWFTGQGYPSYQVQLVKNGLSMQLTLGQTSSHASVPFFEMKVPIRFKAQGYDTLLVFDHASNGQIFDFELPFSPTSIAFDPDKWLIAKSTVQIVTGTENTISPAINLYPNPFGPVLSLQSPANRPVDVEIFNELGQPVWRQSVDGQLVRHIDTHHLSPGIYFIRCAAGAVSSFTKMVKE